MRDLYRYEFPERFPGRRIGAGCRSRPQTLLNDNGVPAPVTASEIPNGPGISPSLVEVLREIPVLPLPDGYWERSGKLRALARRQGRKANLPDTLIVQCCLDNEVPLITRGGNFKVFSRIVGLVIL